MQAVTFISVSSWKTPHMDLACTYTVMDPGMKVSGYKMCRKAKARKFGKTVLDTLELTKMA